MSAGGEITSFGDRLQSEVARKAFEAGYEAGYREGVTWALDEAKKLIGKSFEPKEAQS